MSTSQASEHKMEEPLSASIVYAVQTIIPDELEALKSKIESENIQEAKSERPVKIKPTKQNQPTQQQIERFSELVDLFSRCRFELWYRVEELTREVREVQPYLDMLATMIPPPRSARRSTKRSKVYVDKLMKIFPTPEHCENVLDEMRDLAAKAYQQGHNIEMRAEEIELLLAVIEGETAEALRLSEQELKNKGAYAPYELIDAIEFLKDQKYYEKHIFNCVVHMLVHSSGRMNLPCYKSLEMPAENLGEDGEQISSILHSPAREAKEMMVDVVLSDIGPNFGPTLKSMGLIDEVTEVLEILPWMAEVARKSIPGLSFSCYRSKCTMPMCRAPEPMSPPNFAPRCKTCIDSDHAECCPIAWEKFSECEANIKMCLRCQSFNHTYLQCWVSFPSRRPEWMKRKGRLASLTTQKTFEKNMSVAMEELDLHFKSDEKQARRKQRYREYSMQ